MLESKHNFLEKFVHNQVLFPVAIVNILKQDLYTSVVGILP